MSNPEEKDRMLFLRGESFLVELDGCVTMEEGPGLGGAAKGPTGTPAGGGAATDPSPPVAAIRVDTANAQQSRVLTVVDEPRGAEAAPALAARPKD